MSFDPKILPIVYSPKIAGKSGKNAQNKEELYQGIGLNDSFAYKNYITGTLSFTGKIGKIGTYQTKELDDKYRRELVKGLNEYYNLNVDVKNLSSVIGINEFKEIIKNLKEEDYVYSKDAIENKTFTADIHSHTSCTSGKASVETILDNVAQYADELNAKTNKKFLFAITDHDSVTPVREALKYIAENPEKFKNVNFVTGSEMTYVFKGNKYNTASIGEVLAYGLNPFSKNVIDHFEKLYQGRRETVKNTIEYLDKHCKGYSFNLDEFKKIFGTDVNKNDMFTGNIYWKIYHYAQTKIALTDQARKLKQDPEEYYSKIMLDPNLTQKTLGYMVKKGIVPEDTKENNHAKLIVKQIMPHFDSSGTITSQTETTFKKLKDFAKSEDNIVYAYAHPYYISQRTTKPQNIIGYVKKVLGDKLIATESYHQKYRKDIDRNDIKEFNVEVEKLGLIPIGGRDFHGKNWLEDK